MVGHHGGGSGEAVVEWEPTPATTVGCYRVYRALAEKGSFDLAGVVAVRGTAILTPPGFECVSVCDSSDLAGPDAFVHFDGAKFSFTDYNLRPAARRPPLLLLLPRHGSR